MLYDKPSDADLISALVDYATRGFDARVCLDGVARQTLKNGYGSGRVERIDLMMLDGTGTRSKVSFVLKACRACEVRSLTAVSAVGENEAVPDVVVAWQSLERPLDQEVNGFVSPFYAGGPLTFDDRIPKAVLATLARVHAHYYDGVSVDWAWTFDGAHFRRQHERAMVALNGSTNFRQTTPNYVECLRLLERLGQSDVLIECSDMLPRTLTHGDMHPGNIVLRHDGSPVIIDWGNTCVASPMLDLANIIRIDSPEWQTYLAVSREVQRAVDQETCRRGYWWARAATGLQYLPWVAEHTADAERLIRQIEQAEEQLRVLA